MTEVQNRVEEGVSYVSGHLGYEPTSCSLFSVRLMTLSVDVLEEQFCQISSRSDLKRRSLKLFWRLPKKKKKKKNNNNNI